MDYSRFKKTLTRLLMFKEVKINKEQTDALYELMKDDFTDDEFEGLCVYIAKNETLYTKYPDPSIFYKFKKKTPTETQIKDARMHQEFNEFFDELSSALSATCTAYSGVNLGWLQKRTLMAFGGFNNLWTSVHRDDGFARSIASIKREMQQFYFDNYKHSQILELAGEKSDFSRIVGDVSKKLTCETGIHGN